MLVHRKSSGFSNPYSATQKGASVGSIVFMLLALGVFIKLAIAIIPAQIGDYQNTKEIALELKKANDNKATATEFLKSLQRRWGVSNNDANPNEILTFVNKTPGNLVVNKSYVVEKTFIGNVAILNKFEGEITGNDAE